MSTTLVLVITCVVSIVFSTTYDETQWAEALTAVTDAKASWLASGITDYVYNWRGSCFCEPCWIHQKYIVIEDGTPTYVEFDESAASIGVSCSPMDHIKTPLSDYFYDINYYYDRAIAHAQRGLDADCSDPYNDMICSGGSLTFTYDPTYFYPTAISLNFGNTVADAGQSWTFSCLSPLSDTAACADFTMPSEGDSCGTPGVDCAALKCACAQCTDGSENSYGCCDSCVLVQNALGELLCSGNTPQDLVCPDTVPTCGGIAGIQCADGLFCVDDPSDNCDPNNYYGGADCGGICVSEGDSCENSPDCVGLDCLCAECADGSGSYGCCGCKWQLDAEGVDVTCEASIAQEDVCPIVDCICTLQYDPYCCGGTTYGNGCAAGCAGFDVDSTDSDCVAGECSAACGGFAGVQCEMGLYCVDDPSDGCDPAQGGADCMGICVSEGDSCESSPDCPDLMPLCPCGLCEDGTTKYGCCGCLWQLNDAANGLECSTMISQDVCPDVITTTTADDVITTITTDAEEDSYCEEPIRVTEYDRKVRFDNSDSTVGGFDYCKFCVCRDGDHPKCNRLYELYLNADELTQNLFYAVCTIETYSDLVNENGEQCAWEQLRVKDADAVTECDCSALYCNGNPNFPVDTFGSGVGAKQMSLSIGFMIAVFWWM